MRILTLATALFIFISGCRTRYEVESTWQTEYAFSDTGVNIVDTAILSFIKPFRDKMQDEMNTVIGESEFAMERGLPEGRLGNFVSDACMTEANKTYYATDNKKIDFTFLNNGGLRRALPAGNITRGDVYELMPFENELVVLTLNGKLVKKIFNFIASKGGAPVSGVRFEIVEQQATHVMINGQALDTLSTYKALTSDYLANGGDSYSMLLDVPRETTNLKVRDAIIQFLTSQQGKKISVQTDGRITNAK